MKAYIKIAIIICFILSSCKNQSQIFSLYHSFWNDNATLLLNKKTNDFVLSNGDWACTGIQEWKSKDTLKLHINKILSDKKCGECNEFCNLIFIRKQDCLLNITRDYYNITIDYNYWGDTIWLPEGLSIIPILKTNHDKNYLKNFPWVLR